MAIADGFNENRMCFTEMTEHFRKYEGGVTIKLENGVLHSDKDDFPLGDKAFWERCLTATHVDFIQSLNDSMLEENEEGDNGTYREGNYKLLVRYFVYSMPSLATGPTEHKGVAYVEDDSKAKPVPNTDDYNRSKPNAKELSKYRTIYSKIEDHWYIFYEASD
jgi:hypothetical protein